MFFQRLFTSCLLIPLVLWGIFAAPHWLLGGILGLILLLIAGESLLLIPLTTWSLQLGFIGLLGIAFWICGWWFLPWLWLCMALWISIFVAIVTYPASQAYWGHRGLIGLYLLLVIPIFAQSLVHIYLQPQGPALLVYLFCLIWAADIGAYLVGKICGRHKMIPKVSPGKSWEGLAGALVCSLGVSLLAHWYFGEFPWGPWLIQALCTLVFSVVGDLFISLLKRRCQLKDTGSLLPGHGGVLDRLDSLIAGAPIFYLGLTSLMRI